MDDVLSGAGSLTGRTISDFLALIVHEHTAAKPGPQALRRTRRGKCLVPQSVPFAELTIDPRSVRSAATGFHHHRRHAGFWGNIDGVRKRQCGRHGALGALLMGLLLMGSRLPAEDGPSTDLPAFAVCGNGVECSQPLLTTAWVCG
jgi:hypothetical protein